MFLLSNNQESMLIIPKTKLNFPAFTTPIKTPFIKGAFVIDKSEKAASESLLEKVHTSKMIRLILFKKTGGISHHKPKIQNDK